MRVTTEPGPREGTRLGPWDGKGDQFAFALDVGFGPVGVGRVGGRDKQQALQEGGPLPQRRVGLDLLAA